MSSLFLKTLSRCCTPFYRVIFRERIRAQDFALLLASSTFTSFLHRFHNHSPTLQHRYYITLKPTTTTAAVTTTKHGKWEDNSGCFDGIT
jgi:hypothetical protein